MKHNNKYIMNNIDFSIASSEQVENVLKQRVEAIRLQQNITQRQLARDAGVSLGTVARLKSENTITLNSFVRILIALRLQNHLDGFLPAQSVSPLELLEMRGRVRQRASSRKSETSEWTWDDEA